MADLGVGMPAVFGTPLDGAPRDGPPAVVAVGNFDGVHLGHQRLLQAAREMAGPQGLVVAVTFEPHPAHLLRPQSVPALLTPLRLRRRLLAGAGVDQALVIPFNDRLRAQEPGEFLSRLRHQLAVVGLAAGPRLSLGRDGTGGGEFVRAYAREHRLRLEVVDQVVVGGVAVSSSELRRLVQEGRVSEYPLLAGHPFQVMGEVVRGDGLGRVLGFPTANLRTMPSQLLPPDGVYLMTWRLASGGEPRPAVGSVGTRPHFSGRDRRFEVHGLGPTPDLYGQELIAEVLERVRGQETFRSDAELVARMAEDRRRAEEFFSKER
ncbi:MAG: riboflavin biosynthesis protein RibF [Candidatus Dormibacteria bacterium]